LFIVIKGEIIGRQNVAGRSINLNRKPWERVSSVTHRLPTS